MRSSSGISRWQFVHELDQKSTSVTVPVGWPSAFIHSVEARAGSVPQSFPVPRAHWAKSPRASTSCSGSHAPVSQASSSPAWSEAV